MADVSRAADDGRGGCGCKVGTAIREYGLAGANAELRERWTAPDGEGLRALAAAFNRRILRAALLAAGRRPLDGEVANLHRLLTGPSVSSGKRTETRRRLERDGVDVERVLADFVSHQTVYRHLTGCLGVEKEAPEEDPDERRKRDLDRVRALQSRAAAVTESTLDRLRRAGLVELGAANVFVEVSVACEECASQYEVGTLLERGGCDCR